MRWLRPPVLATWLLQRFGVNDARLGDLLEQRQAGRSQIWYWRQVLAVIAITTINDIREHKLLTLRGLAIGWVVLTLLVRFVSFPLSVMDDWLFTTGLADLRDSWPDHRLLLLALVSISCLYVGRLVARWHRMPAIIALVATAVFVDAYSFSRVRFGSPWDPYEPFFRIAFLFGAPSISLLLGGLWGASDDEAKHLQRW